MKDLKSLLDLLLNPGEECCPGPDRFGYHSTTIPAILSGTVTLVSNNPKVPIKRFKSDTLTHMAINPVKGKRNDDNVTAYRTFMWEIDVGKLSSQIEYFKKLGMPYSAAIYSGGKSIHFLTVLDHDIDKKTYYLLYNWALKVLTLCDDNCKNPTRCVRVPGAIRPETGKKQRLVEMRGRVKFEDFQAWFDKHPDSKPQAREERKTLTGEGDYERLSPWAQKQLFDGGKNMDFSKGRNRAWFALAVDLAKSGYTEDEAVNILGKRYQEEHDFKEKEWLATIKSGFKYSEGS